jgi:hypothetical protein
MERGCLMERKVHTSYNWISEASKHAREADIDVPSKRSFRQMYASRDTSPPSPMNAGPGLYEEITRTEIDWGTFLDCLLDVKNRVEQSRTDDFIRKSYRRLPE